MMPHNILLNGNCRTLAVWICIFSSLETWVCSNNTFSGLLIYNYSYLWHLVQSITFLLLEFISAFMNICPLCCCFSGYNSMQYIAFERKKDPQRRSTAMEIWYIQDRWKIYLLACFLGGGGLKFPEKVKELSTFYNNIKLSFLFTREMRKIQLSLLSTIRIDISYKRHKCTPV